MKEKINERMLAVATARVWLIVTAAKRIGAFESCTRKSMQTLKLLTKWDCDSDSSISLLFLHFVLVNLSTHTSWCVTMKPRSRSSAFWLEVLVLWFWQQDLQHYCQKRAIQDWWSKVMILFWFLPILLTIGPISFWFWNSGLSYYI